MPANNRINRGADRFNRGETPLHGGTAGQILDRQLRDCAIIPDRSQGHRIRSSFASLVITRHIGATPAEEGEPSNYWLAFWDADADRLTTS
jgi:hypothetical protein